MVPNVIAAAAMILVLVVGAGLVFIFRINLTPAPSPQVERGASPQDAFYFRVLAGLLFLDASK